MRLTLLALLVLGAPAANAQGTLSTQGFGYPPGQLSARAAAMGGGIAETDPFSPLNPAALADWGRPGFYIQYSPEYRSVSSPGHEDNTMTARFPVLGGALTIGQRAVIGVSSSTLLDRTWQTQRTGVDPTSGSGVQFTESFRSDGAINDTRVALSVNIAHGLWIGVGGHAFSGDNQLRITRTSADTTSANFDQKSKLSYAGSGASAGIVWQPASHLTLAVSGRLGGRITSYRNDTTLTHADVPKRLGGGATFSLPGLVVSARADWEGWSSLAPLGTPGLGVVDAWDYGVGAEVAGPTFLGAALPLRVGYRHRTLPFTVDGTEVRENTFSVGVGVPISRGRSRIDLGFQRANRGTIEGISEHAWTFNAGFMVRP
ncbi:MAG: hypothetical protein IRY91_10310 [Gemmatimonadaceae bacterium]|nr:hypothetical protein [Gemmatimonadaceae bacterium]